jgi:hypothetical protein
VFQSCLSIFGDGDEEKENFIHHTVRDPGHQVDWACASLISASEREVDSWKQHEHRLQNLFCRGRSHPQGHKSYHLDLWQHANKSPPPPPPPMDSEEEAREWLYSRPCATP